MKYFNRFRDFIVGFIALFVIASCIAIAGLSYSTRLQSDNIKFDEISKLSEEKKIELINNQTKVVEISKNTRGIDVSSWQGKIDWNTVAKYNYDFVMLRVGLRNILDDEISEDERFRYNISECNRLGIPVGVYFYSTATNEKEVLEEAKFTLNLIKDYKITYPVAYDLEAIGQGRLENVSDDVINYNALLFLDYFKSHGYNGMLYGNKTALTGHWYLDRFSDYKIWYANYSDELYDGRMDMYQYIDNGRINGVYASVDFNSANFSYSEIIDEGLK